MKNKRPTVIRSKSWFFEIRLPQLVSKSSDLSLLEFGTMVAKEAYTAQADHIAALEKREEAVSDVLDQIKEKCPKCEIGKQAKELLENK